MPTTTPFGHEGGKKAKKESNSEENRAARTIHPYTQNIVQPRQERELPVSLACRFGGEALRQSKRDAM